MNKTQKIEFINEINERFTNAKNHGSNGNNWWYPTPNVIAYNVKMYGGSYSIEDIRKNMTKRQNEYYSDESIYSIIEDIRDMSREDLVSNVINMGAKKAYFAGRSGGWLEVEYSNNLDEITEEDKMSDINYNYQEAKKLEKLESEVSEYVNNFISNLSKYEDSKDYTRDIADNMLDDESIGDIYKSQAQKLIDKLQ